MPLIYLVTIRALSQAVTNIPIFGPTCAARATSLKEVKLKRIFKDILHGGGNFKSFLLINRKTSKSRIGIR